MSGDKRNATPAGSPRPPGVVRVIESPRSIDTPAHVTGAGQCLFLLFRDELLALRQRQRAVTTPAREVSRV